MGKRTTLSLSGKSVASTMFGRAAEVPNILSTKCSINLIVGLSGPVSKIDSMTCTVQYM